MLFANRILLLCFFCLGTAWGCGANPDIDSEGNPIQGGCVSRCSQPKIASENMRVRFLFTSAETTDTPVISISCGGKSGDYPNPLAIRFVVEKPRTVLPVEDPAINAPVIGGPAPTSVVGELTKWVPVSGISFDAVVVGGIATRNDFETIGDSCTDSCGVGVFTLTPKCTGSSDTITVEVHSGSLANTLQVSVGT